MSPKPQDPEATLDGARHLLAGIEADIQRGEATLRRAQEEGPAHFATRLEPPTEAILDGWSAETRASASVSGLPAGD